VGRYLDKYYGSPAMRVGVLQFGNGAIMGATVSPAINVQPITDDFSGVRSKIKDMPFKKGFTNMAQAFALAETMFSVKGRPGAQSAILIITDGQPSFQFQTNEMVVQLNDKNIQRFFVVVSEGGGHSLDLMKTWASKPWATNLLHIPGLVVLESDVGLWAQKVLTLFCPVAMSPSSMIYQDTTVGFMKVREGGFCGEKGNLLSDKVESAADCAELAKQFGSSAFILGTSFRKGHCFSSTMVVDEQQYKLWEETRVNPGCSTEWVSSDIFDFYAVRERQEMFAEPEPKLSKSTRRQGKR